MNFFKSIPELDRKRQTVVALTPRGDESVATFAGSGKQFTVMCDLHEHGASTDREVSKRTNIRREEVHAILNQLAEQELVRKVGGQ